MYQAQPFAPNSLLTLGKDVLVGQIFTCLQLQDLQAVKNAGCKELRAWVTGAPEAVWRAAALNTTAPYHPMLRSGNIHTYLAQQAARDATAGLNWSQRPVSIPPSGAAEAQEDAWARTSHAGTYVIRHLWASDRLAIEHVASAATRSIILPAGYEPGTPPVFSPDEAAVAVALKLRLRSSSSAPSLLLAIANIAAAECWVVSVPHALDPESTFDLRWAGTAQHVCLVSRSADTFWVFDRELAPLAALQGASGRAVWNASGTGLLISRPAEQRRGYRWCLLPQQPDEAAVISGVMTDVGALRWGPWLPGSGEVMLGMRNRALSCWGACRETGGWVELGTVLTPAPHNFLEVTWAASFRHVALVSLDGWLLIYCLQPGPQLQEIHASRCGDISRSLMVSFSIDGRNVLHRETPGAREGPDKLARLQNVLITHVLSGKTTRVMPAVGNEHFGAFWLPDGICVEL